MSPSMPTGFLVVREHGGRVYFEGKWRSSGGAQRKKRLGRAWLRRRSSGAWTKETGRVKDGYLDERRAHIKLAGIIEADGRASEGRTWESGAGLRGRSDCLARSPPARETGEAVNAEGVSDPARRPTCDAKGSSPEEQERWSGDAGVRWRKLIWDRRCMTCRSFLGELDREEISAGTVNKHRQVLHAMFEFASRWETFGLTENPASATSKRPEGGANRSDFEPNEVEMIPKAARKGLHRRRPEHDYSVETHAE